MEGKLCFGLCIAELLSGKPSDDMPSGAPKAALLYCNNVSCEIIGMGTVTCEHVYASPNSFLFVWCREIVVRGNR